MNLGGFWVRHCSKMCNLSPCQTATNFLRHACLSLSVGCLITCHNMAPAWTPTDVRIPRENRWNNRESTTLISDRGHFSGCNRTERQRFRLYICGEITRFTPSPRGFPSKLPWLLHYKGKSTWPETIKEQTTRRLSEQNIDQTVCCHLVYRSKDFYWCLIFYVIKTTILSYVR